MTNFNDKVTFIWKIANLLRGPYTPDKYKDVMLPLVVLRRFDCLLEATKDAVIEQAKKADIEQLLNKTAGYPFSNKSYYTFERLLNDSDNIKANFEDYINGFSANIREIMENFQLDINKLEKEGLLYLLIKEFASIDLHPEVVSNQEMGYIFEELIRRFSENAEAGDHYTPREGIHLMTNLLFVNQDDELMKEGAIITIGDYACGTGGMLSVARDYIMSMNPTAQVEVFGQEINAQSYAICKSDILIKGQNPKNIVHGNTLTEDGHKHQKVRYALMNPPFGVTWNKEEKKVKDEHTEKGFDGRFGAGVPKVSDGSLLFMQHMISKMKDDEQGSRMAIVSNGSPLFAGDKGSVEIRRWLIENDLLEGIIALPTDMFYNTGIATYIWIFTNRKNDDPLKGQVRTGKIQLVDGTSFYQKMRKSLGNKRNELTNEHIDEITRIYSEFKDDEHSKILDNKELGYLIVPIQRPLKLNFQIKEERFENLYSESAFGNLYNEEKVEEIELKIEKQTVKKKEITTLEKFKEGKKLQEQIFDLLKANESDVLYKNREIFKKHLDGLFEDLKLPANIQKAILMGLSKRDETAEHCMKGKKKEADSSLKDTEKIPMSVDVDEYKEDYSSHVKMELANINAYLEHEVAPHVDEYWYDEKDIQIGYEIPFTRYFYKFEELRPFVDIMQEIESLEKEIQGEIGRVLS